MFPPLQIGPLQIGPLQIGDVSIPGRVLIAPMTGVTDLPFRRQASRLGAAYVATEMVACADAGQGARSMYQPRCLRKMRRPRASP